MDNKDFSAMVTEIVNDIIYISDIKDYKLYYLNRAALELLGNPSASEWLGQPCYRVLQNATEPCAFCTNHLLNADEFYIWDHYNPVVNRHFSVRDKLIAYNGVSARLEVAVDITEKALAEKQLREQLKAEETLVACIQTLRGANNVEVAINNLLGIIANYHTSQRAYIFEVDYENHLLINTYEWCDEGIISHIEDLKALPLQVADRWFEQFEENGEFYISNLDANVAKDSKEYEILAAQEIEGLMAAPLIDGNNRIIGFLGVDDPTTNVENMTLLRSVSAFIVDDLEKRATTEKLMQLSFTDGLTGMENRHSYIQRIRGVDRLQPKYMGVVYVDINGLKVINDTLGHQYGDKLIIYVAETLTQIFKDDIYRVGGDEFVILCQDVDKRSFDKMIQRLRKQSKEDVGLKISIGASWKSADIKIVQQIEDTDKAMYLEKQKYYGTRTEGSGKYQATLARTLMNDIQDGKFTIHLQPQTNLSTNVVHRAEALVRRIGAKGELELPAKFIGAYEKEGIIRHIDFFVFEEVCKVLSQWHKSGKGNAMWVSVNFSRLTLLENDVVEKLIEVCKAYEVSPASIAIEITEMVGHMELESLSERMGHFVEAGFFISLDDFGSQWSNLEMLSTIKFNEIKLGKSLIDTIVGNEKVRVITEHAIAMCKNLGCDISVGKGIETAEQYELLKTFNCTLGQGYYIDKPMPIGAFTEKYV